jgi:uncharacterized membrane protein
MKRLTWFLGGAVAGVAGVGVAKRKVKAAAAELAPAQVARKARTRLRDALHEGRRAMRAKEAELRARLDGRSGTLADELDAGDQLLVDGRSVEPGQVIVLKQVRERRHPSGGPRRRA